MLKASHDFKYDRHAEIKAEDEDYVLYDAYEKGRLIYPNMRRVAQYFYSDYTLV